MPAFSIIIPLYNKENYVFDTISSVLNQQITDYEILVIDDCSTDNSILEVKKHNDSRIKIFQNSVNKGLSESRNIGVKNAQAPYIAFLDADDHWKPNFLALIQKLITDYPEASLYGTNYQEGYPNSIYLEPKKNLPTPNFKEGIIPDFFISNIKQHIYNFSSFCVKKTIFETVGYFNPTITFAEDVDFNIRINLHFKLAYTTQIGATYMMDSENQITQSKISSKKIPDFLFYEHQFPEHKNLKQYLDFNRYIIAKHYKTENYTIGFQSLLKEIDFQNLNLKQLVLLYSPRFLLKTIKAIKAILLNKGIRLTSYS